MTSVEPAHAGGNNSATTRKAAGIIAGCIAGLVVCGGIAYGADLFLSQGKVPRGVTVGGVPIGGMELNEASGVLESRLGNSLAKPVSVTAGELSTTFIPDQAGLSVDWAGTVAAAGDQPLNPWTRLSSFFNAREVPIASVVDAAALDPVVQQVQQQLSPAPIDAGVVLRDGAALVDPQPTNGQVVQAAELRTNMVEDWLDPQGVKVSSKELEPTYGKDAAEEILKDAAQKAVSAPFVVHGRDNIDGVIPPARMGEVLSFVPDEATGKFRTEFNIDALTGILLETLHTTETPLKNAQISYAGGSKTVTPHSDGVTIDWEKTLEGYEQRIIGDEPRDVDAVYIDEPATFTTEMAEKASFDQVVSEFTTSGYSDASGVNIAKVAAMVDGAIVAPGETFSLNGFTGPRGAAQGFVESGIILNGRADKAVGGGISQFATTLYNAAYFAGFEDVAHTAHSYYISRYPAGREATVFEGSIDLKFKNTSPYPVLIRSSAGGGNVTVQFMGVKTVNVESVNGGRWATTEPKKVKVPGDECVASAGAPGFTTSDTRIIRDLSGKELSRKTTTTVYDPQPIVTCD